MPLYEYTCRECDCEFEELVFAETETVHCPKCDKPQVEKKISVPARPSSSLPQGGGCDSAGPPCGPRCCRL